MLLFHIRADLQVWEDCQYLCLRNGETTLSYKMCPEMLFALLYA